MIVGTMKESDLIRVAESVCLENEARNLVYILPLNWAHDKELEVMKSALTMVQNKFEECRGELETCRRSRLELIEKNVRQLEDLKKAWGLFATMEAESEKV